MLVPGEAIGSYQVRGEPADARTDLWALGVLLYELAGGAAPFRGATLRSCSRRF